VRGPRRRGGNVKAGDAKVNAYDVLMLAFLAVAGYWLGKTAGWLE